MSGHTLGDVAMAIGARLEGVAERAVAGMAPLTEAGPKDLCFAESVAMLDAVNSSQAAGFIVGEDFPVLPTLNLLRVADPRSGFVRALELFAPVDGPKGVHANALVAEDCELADGVGIGPLVVIEPGVTIGAGSRVRAGAYVGRGVHVGEHCDIGPNCVLLDGTRLGDRCILHPGVVLGSDGYGYMWQGDHHHKIPQLGIVEIGDDVEIGANCCIDRATLGATRIGSGTKLDNLVHIAHNNTIGRHVLLTAQVGIAGSSRLGDGVVMGGQSGVSDHVAVGDRVQIGGQTGVFDDVSAGRKVWGTPARAMTRTIREQVLIGRLPETQQRLRRQEQELKALRDRIAALEERGSE